MCLFWYPTIFTIFCHPWVYVSTALFRTILKDLKQIQVTSPNVIGMEPNIIKGKMCDQDTHFSYLLEPVIAKIIKNHVDDFTSKSCLCFDLSRLLCSILEQGTQFLFLKKTKTKVIHVMTATGFCLFVCNRGNTIHYPCLHCARSTVENSRYLVRSWIFTNSGDWFYL